MQKRVGEIEPSRLGHRRGILSMVTRPRHVTINEALVRPTEQEG